MIQHQRFLHENNLMFFLKHPLGISTENEGHIDKSKTNLVEMSLETARMKAPVDLIGILKIPKSV